MDNALKTTEALTHSFLIHKGNKKLFINPGSPTLPHHKEVRLGTAAILELSPQSVRAEIVHLGETPGRRNPGTAKVLQARREAFARST